MKSLKPATSHSRASVACTACQSRRVKCIKSPGESRCDQCRRGNLECATRPDRRRRTTSRAEVDSLRSRLQSLEAILRSQSASGISVNLPPLHVLNESNSAETAEPKEPLLNPSCSETQTTDTAVDSEQQSSELQMSMDFTPRPHECLCGKAPDSPLVDLMSAGPSKVLIDRLISPGYHGLYDQSSGKIRHSCPIIAFHQFSDLTLGNSTGNCREQDRRVERLLRELNPATHDHLMESFWSYYDPVMQVVDREVFEEDRRSGGGLTYSGFLHICILAMGYKYADLKRPDIQKLALQKKESTLHREAKYLVEFEFEKPGGIPSVQALLILGQLESGCGRDAVGWIYAGVAFRYAFDLGLNIDCSTLNLTERERKFRKFVLRACTAFDKLWAIYLGRLTTIRSPDLMHHVYLQPPQKLKDNNSKIDFISENNVDIQCFDALLVLLDITAKVIECLYSRQTSIDHSDFLVISSLDSELKAWYDRLPCTLSWTPENFETAPLSYFHLHSQYHASLVLLHGPLASYEQTKFEQNSEGDLIMKGMSKVSRTVCMKHIFNMISILSRQVQRFDAIRSPQAELQHIGTAVAVLISATAVSTDSQERMKLLESLHILAELARAISPTYMPAEMISDILENLLKEPGWGYESASGSEQGEVPTDAASKYLSSDGDLFKNLPSLPIKEGCRNYPSSPTLKDDFNFNLEPQDTIEVVSNYEVGGVGGTGGSNGMTSTSIDLSPPSSLRVENHETFHQISWTIPPFSPIDELGDNYTLKHFQNLDSQFQTLL